MARKPVADNEFSRLLSKLQSRTDSMEEKLDTVYYFCGDFSGTQTASLLSCFKSAPEKIKLLQILQTRLCRMSCAEGRDLLNQIQLTQRDKLFALDCIKRTLCDHQTSEGIEYILSAFYNETDKMRALERLTGISSYVNQELAAGGNQLYSAIGNLYSQSAPLSEHMYGPVKQQLGNKPEKGASFMTHTVMDKPKSMYLCHPSYAYEKCADPSYYLGGGKPPLPVALTDNATQGIPHYLGKQSAPLAGEQEECHYGENPCLGLHQSGPTTIGFIDHEEQKHSQCC